MKKILILDGQSTPLPRCAKTIKCIAKRRSMRIQLTGWHAFQVALLLPAARILAVDISLASIAYARRKTREQGLQNIEYAQADILKLGNIGRSFDRIEAVGAPPGGAREWMAGIAFFAAPGG